MAILEVKLVESKKGLPKQSTFHFPYYFILTFKTRKKYSISHKSPVYIMILIDNKKLFLIKVFFVVQLKRQLVTHAAHALHHRE